MSDFELYSVENAPEGSLEPLAKTEKEFGMIPNLMKVLAGSPEALKAYLGLHENFSATSLDPVERQVVILATSFENDCHYCMAAHSAVARKVGASDDVVEALRSGEPLSDARLEALRRFTSTIVRERGWVGEEEVEHFLEAGFDRSQVLDVLVGVAQKTLSNYLNHIAETPLDDAFRSEEWEAPEEAVAV